MPVNSRWDLIRRVKVKGGFRYCRAAAGPALYGNLSGPPGVFVGDI